jgi:hypothetical protein
MDITKHTTGMWKLSRSKGFTTIETKEIKKVFIPLSESKIDVQSKTY